MCNGKKTVFDKFQVYYFSAYVKIYLPTKITLFPDTVTYTTFIAGLLFKYNILFMFDLCNLNDILDYSADTVIVVDDSQHTPEQVKPKWWLQHFQLASADLDRLLTGQELTDAIMNAAQKMFQSQFPDCQSLQDVTLGTLLMFAPLPRTQVGIPAVQILHTGKQNCSKK